jgi:hypothetical protein
MKEYGGKEVYLHAFLTSTLNRDGQLHPSVAFLSGKKPPVHFI